MTGLVEDITHYGFYKFKRIQLTQSEQSKYWFYDVAILATQQKDEETLKKLSVSPDTMKCCWWDKYQNNMNGIGRVMFYRDKKGDGTDPEYLYYIWEGQIENGLPKGFIRYIQPKRSFIGYLKNLGQTMQGTALYYETEQLKWASFYSDDVRFRRTKPESEKLY